MKIFLPPVKQLLPVKTGDILKVFSRTRSIDSALTKHAENGHTFYTIKDSGNEVLILFGEVPKSIRNRYRYIVNQDIERATESEDLLDISQFQWVKNPLLEDRFSKTFTKESVWNSWKDAFTIKTDEANGNGFRVPQVGALYAIQAHWTISTEPGIVVLPTGTGKTDTMIGTLIMSRIQTLLLIVPTDALREQLAGKFLSLGILPEYSIVREECECPIVGVMKHKFANAGEAKVFFDGVNVVVATMSVIAGCSDEVQAQIARSTTHLFIDEAHHTPAETWREFKKRFSNSKVLLFTATPFRNDGKRLEGKIIFNFPLRKAQELDYFRPIHFNPVHAYEEKVADELIADLAVRQLKEDLAAGYDHILMVRVNLIERAEKIFPLYSKFSEFNPVLVHSQIRPKSKLRNITSDIVARKHRIIICVDMLGEGFDLPELKIAAFHDTKKSLTITLQLAGRFTRVKPNLGPATFIANIADPQVHEDLEDLYYRDSDWNVLLPDMSYKMSLEQEDFRSFLDGFKGFPDKFPVQSIKHPLSTIIFTAPDDKWRPLKYRDGIKGLDNFQYHYSDYNKEREILIVILGKRSIVKWARVADFESVDWNIIICYFDKATRLLYLHASNTGSYYLPFVDSICAGAQLLHGQIIFRCFHGLNRVRLHNVGVREPLGRAVNYIMRVGSDIRRALRDTELKKAIKSNVFGVGFEHGARVSIGCSHHGRVWSMRTNNILTWISWCKAVALKITDPTIDPDIVLRGTLIPQDIGSVPAELAFAIEWPDVIFRQSIGNFEIVWMNEQYPVWNCDIALITQNTERIQFDIILPSGSHRFELHLFKDDKGNSFRFSSKEQLFLQEGNDRTEMGQFFTRYPPLIYFVDGSFLEGNLYTKIHEIIPSFSVDKFELHDWSGVNIRKESQTVEKYADSIQGNLIHKLLLEGKYGILMDDDDKGEIGDVVGFQVFEEQKVLVIDVYHCKYSSESTPGLRLADFYEVCGQAQRSIKWMEDTEEIFRHLGRRNSERVRRTGVDRFELGDEAMLDVLKRRAKRDLKVRMNIFIVQPGLSFGDYREGSDVSKLLAVVETYLKETWNADLKVIASE